MNNCINHCLNLTKLEERCIENCEFLQLVKKIFASDPLVVEHANAADDSTFKLSHALRYVDIEKFASSKEPGNMSRYPIEQLFWEVKN